MKKALSQAKILTIDRNKGRVTLAMKNGLISTGTYLYDLNDLRVGMIVLIGKVSGSYVILNKMPRNLAKASAMMTIAPETTDSFIRIAYFNQDSYMDSFLSGAVDTSMWGSVYPVISYSYDEENGEWVWERIYRDTGQLFENMSIDISNGELRPEVPCTGHGSGEIPYAMFYCKHFVSAGSDMNVETCVTIDHGIYYLNFVTNPASVTTIYLDNITKVFLRITKVGDIWSAYYKLSEGSSWILAKTFTKATEPDYEMYSGFNYYANYDGVVRVFMTEARRGGSIWTQPPYHMYASFEITVQGNELDI